MRLSRLPGSYAICRLAPAEGIPPWAIEEHTFLSVTRTAEETSVVCIADLVPQGVQCESGWAALKVEGPLELSLTGVLASLAAPLASAGIAIFSVSTFDTDHLLVKVEQLPSARKALADAGHILDC